MARAPQAVAEVVEAPVEEMAVEETDAPVVVLTLLRNADGSYVLQAGDEPEMVEGGEPMAMPEGQSYPPDEAGVGALMTAILDMVDPENSSGPQAQANFTEGYGAEEAPPAV